MSRPAREVIASAGGPLCERHVVDDISLTHDCMPRDLCPGCLREERDEAVAKVALQEELR